MMTMELGYDLRQPLAIILFINIWDDSLNLNDYHIFKFKSEKLGIFYGCMDVRLMTRWSGVRTTDGLSAQSPSTQCASNESDHD